MSRDVGSWAKSCISCQKSKISTHVHSTVSPIPVPTWRFSYVHMDLVGPLPSSHGFIYLFTMIDRTTRWSEAVPLSCIIAESCAHAFISTWISRFGVPAVLTSDRGSQFTSSIWTGVCFMVGISASTTTSFNPQSNGMVERFHRSLKSSLRARLAGSDWFSHLPLESHSERWYWPLSFRGCVQFLFDLTWWTYRHSWATPWCLPQES